MSLLLSSVVDTGVLVLCALALFRYARLTSAHPGFMYLLYHFMFFTLRMYGVLAGAPTLFTHWRGAIPVKDSELAWACMLADAALVSMTAAFVLCAQREGHCMPSPQIQRERGVKLLSRNVVILVSAIALPIGVVALLAFGYVPNAGRVNVDVGQWGSSSWTLVTQLWPVLVLLALIYCYGFRQLWMWLMGILLALMAIQGYNRFRVILPVIFLLITWQTRTGQKWPKKWMVFAFVCLSIMSVSMKQVGKMIRSDESAENVQRVVLDNLTDTIQGASDDQKNLDMFASVIWLVDTSGRHFYGTMYYPLLFLPIPRQIWSDKPDLNWYWKEINSNARPMYSNGMVSTMLGEAYANFGGIGVVVVPFFIAYGLGMTYFRAMKMPYFSVFRFIYVIIASSLVQVFRDGLISLVVFPVVNLMPLTAIAVLSWFWQGRRVPSQLAKA